MYSSSKVQAKALVSLSDKLTLLIPLTSYEFELNFEEENDFRVAKPLSGQSPKMSSLDPLLSRRNDQFVGLSHSLASGLRLVGWTM